MNEYLSNIKLSINIRPVQFVYFYKKGNKSDLIRILKFVNTQWGGIYNLIIPILSNGKSYPFFQQVLKLHTADKYVSTLSIDDNKKIKNNLEKLIPNRKIGIGSFDVFENLDQSAHPLGFITTKETTHYTLLCPKVKKIKIKK